MAIGADAEQPPKSVLGRALGVLGAFSDSSPELALADIVAVTGLPPATAHRIVAELVAWGALERVGRGRYRVGMRLWQLGALAPVARDLREAALPPMQDLAAVTGHVVHLVVLDGLPGAVRRAARRARRTRTVRSRVGRRHADARERPGQGAARPRPAAAGRGDPRARAAPPRPGHHHRRRHAALALDDIRRTGYCLSHEEMTEGVVHGRRADHRRRGPGGGRAVGRRAGSTVPLQPLIPAVQLAAAAASRRLGRQPAE